LECGQSFPEKWLLSCLGSDLLALREMQALSYLGTGSAVFKKSVPKLTKRFPLEKESRLPYNL
jgi:hypothetical protein